MELACQACRRRAIKTTCPPNTSFKRCATMDTIQNFFCISRRSTASCTGIHLPLDLGRSKLN